MDPEEIAAIRECTERFVLDYFAVHATWKLPANSNCARIIEHPITVEWVPRATTEDDRKIRKPRRPRVLTPEQKARKKLLAGARICRARRPMTVDERKAKSERRKERDKMQKGIKR